MEVNGYLHSPVALPLEKETPVLIGWALESSLTLGGRDESFSHAGYLTRNPRETSPLFSLSTQYAIPVSNYYYYYYYYYY